MRTKYMIRPIDDELEIFYLFKVGNWATSPVSNEQDEGGKCQLATQQDMYNKLQIKQIYS